jgi:hypothetical protein
VIDHVGRDHLRDRSGIAVNVLKTVEVTACDRRQRSRFVAVAEIIVTSIEAFSRACWCTAHMAAEMIDC